MQKKYAQDFSGQARSSRILVSKNSDIKNISPLMIKNSTQNQSPAWLSISKERKAPVHKRVEKVKNVKPP